MFKACGEFLSEDGALSFEGLVHAYQAGVLNVDEHLAELRMRPLDALELRKSQMIFRMFANPDSKRISMQGMRSLMTAVSPKVNFGEAQMNAITKVWIPVDCSDMLEWRDHCDSQQRQKCTQIWTFHSFQMQPCTFSGFVYLESLSDDCSKQLRLPHGHKPTN